MESGSMMGLGKKIMLFFGWLIVCVILILPQRVTAQAVIVTDHFSIYYNASVENTARRVAEVAEEVYAPLVSAFDAFDDMSQVYIWVHDDSDFSNGFANYAQNKIEIWASDLEFELRGSTHWIRNVLTHELAHIVSLKIAKNGLLSYTVLNLGRYNVNPDYVFSLPFYHLNVPTWYAEGIAQFESQKMGHDAWDTHRDMLLRMAALENDLLSYDDMGVFLKDGLHSEMVYNQGFALVNYIESHYGQGKAEDLAHHTGLFRFDKALGSVLGVKGQALYDSWTRDLKGGYEGLLRGKLAESVSQSSALPEWPPYLKNRDALPLHPLTQQSQEGRLLIDGGYLDHFPALSPDGKMIAYISNQGYEYALTHLKLYNTETGEVKTLVKQVGSRVSWTPDSKQLVYSKRKGRFYDLYVYDLATEKEKRISRNLRSKDPAVSPDGKTVAFVRNKDGSTNLALVGIDGVGLRYLSNYNDGTQIFSPAWSPDGNQIAISIFREKDRDIAIVDAHAASFIKPGEAPDSSAFLDESAITVLIHSDADERDPVWLPDGSGLVFSSDRDGIFNLYEYRMDTMDTEELIQRSNVLGGAFSPSVASDGKSIVYAGYHAANYNVYHLAMDAFAMPVALDLVEKEYTAIYTGQALKDLYTVGRGSNGISLLGATPILNFSPNFVGNRFTINTVNLGLQVALGDLWGNDYFVGTGVVGKALDHADKLDINYTLNGYYEHRLPPVLTEDRTLAPTGYGYYQKRVINDYDDVSNSYEEEVTGDLLVYNQWGQIDTLRNVRIEFDETLTGGDVSTYDFTVYGAGLDVPINRNQVAGLHYAHRDYRWEVSRDWYYENNTRFFSSNGQELLFYGYPYSETVQLNLFDSKFFSSNEWSLSWQYVKTKPTADAIINPRGARLFYLGISRLNSTLTDSLITLELEEGDGGPTNVPSMKEFPANELTLQWIELLDLPIKRHMLGMETMAVILSKRIPDYDELVDIDGYFPLRHYLGGYSTLRGYPYFTLRGSKLWFHRFKYTFPVFNHIGKQVFHLYFDRLYASLFYEVGGMYNFDTFSLEHIKHSGSWLQDYGVELRLSMMHFYRIPATAYMTFAWPAKDWEDASVSKGDRRFYFGLRLGGSY